MTPRQQLNTVVGHSDNDVGVLGSSNSYIGVYGFSQSGIGVVGGTYDANGAGVYAQGAGPLGTALRIENGGIKVAGAGIGTSTPVFVHVATAGNIVATNQTIITHPLTDGKPNAILIITPSYNYANTGGVNNPHPVGVFYNGNYNK